MTPGSPIPAETGCISLACRLLPRLQISRPKASSSMRALPAYHAAIDAMINSQPVTVISDSIPVSSPIAPMVDPAARNVKKVTNPRFSATAAATATQVIAASTMNQKPISGQRPDGGESLPTAKITFRTPYAIQNEPHIPWIAVATPSRALYAHMPAKNWARPPKIAANGNRYSDVVESPNQ